MKKRKKTIKIKEKRKKTDEEKLINDKIMKESRKKTMNE